MKDFVQPYPPGYLEDISVGVCYTQWILSFFRPWIHGNLCEVGAGNGTISKHLVLREHVSSLVLLEPDKGLFMNLQQSLGPNPQASLFNKTLREYSSDYCGVFDVFIYINVLEHVDDDEAELRLMYSMLSKDGVVLIFVPALQALFSKYDASIGHCRRYSKTELKDKISRAGFELIDLRYFDFVGMFVWFFVCKLLRMRPQSGSVSLYDRIFVRFSKWLEARWIPMIGKNLLAVAVKR